ncbi:MAG: alpha/beta hydrolase [Candidatus Binatus sp.]|uniref:alpha/beta fold hydrolase n=1 Tax=Candidatus Binatus sp. TaxID=2811406 RepID=UPI00272759EE|nr:alpha/beta hydrolase [Candidatus Binatus sp.]MDO8433430.1 alpha/beta hydrolase [Candidatus Binatus sp.]
MSEIKHSYVRSNGIELHVAEMGEGFPVVMCHGFPEMWYSWRHQMKALAEAGFRAIAPDQRGYGDSSCPQPIEAYTQRKLVGDIVGMLDALNLGKCVIVGHDWGGMVAWNAAMMAPDSVERVIGVNTPFIPRSPMKPTDAMRAMTAGGFHYILYFQTPGVAEAELERDVERSLRAFYQDPVNIDPAEVRKAPPGVFGQAGGGLLDRFSDRPYGKFLTEQDFQRFVQAFKKSGFRGGLNWYRCIDRNWEESLGQVDRVEQPALMITAELDVVLRPEMAEGMNKWVPNLRKTVLVKGSGHWTQQEKPAEVNAAIIEFLSDMKK